MSSQFTGISEKSVGDETGKTHSEEVPHLALREGLQRRYESTEVVRRSQYCRGGTKSWIGGRRAVCVAGE